MHIAPAPLPRAPIHLTGATRRRMPSGHAAVPFPCSVNARRASAVRAPTCLMARADCAAATPPTPCPSPLLKSVPAWRSEVREVRRAVAAGLRRRHRGRRGRRGMLLELELLLLLLRHHCDIWRGKRVTRRGPSRRRWV